MNFKILKFCFVFLVAGRTYLTVGQFNPEYIGTDGKEIEPNKPTPRLLQKPCDHDWEPYENEYCIKVFDQEQVKPQKSYEVAEKFCSLYEGNLVTINDAKKQVFLENYLRLKKVPANVWIGLETKDNKTYKWSDGTSLRYQNWVESSPKNNSQYCVQVQTDTARFGNWSDISCNQANLVICEKMQIKPSSKLFKELKDLKRKIKDLVDNIMPKGYIYVQLPSQKEPKTLFPSFSWQDVSSEYKGAFFRALGGQSNSFNDTQEGRMPELYKVVAHPSTDEHDHRKASPIPVGGESNRAFCGTDPAIANYNKEFIGWKYYFSGTEVRPKNMAIKIWKRI